MHKQPKLSMAPLFLCQLFTLTSPILALLPSSPPNGQWLLAIAPLPTTAPKSHPPFGNSCLCPEIAFCFFRIILITQKEGKKKTVGICHKFSMDFHLICPSFPLLVSSSVSFSCICNARCLQIQT